jgi:hypothetical protein
MSIRDLLYYLLRRGDEPVGHDEEHRLLRELLHELRKLTHSHPHSVEIQFPSQSDDIEEKKVMAAVTLNVGESKTAVVVVKDQFGAVMTGFDFAANPPTWSIGDAAVATATAGPSPDHEAVAGVAVGTTTLTVAVPNVQNGTDTASITVVAPPPPTLVATSVEIQFP